MVNLPMAASQDDPGSNPGRADRSFDWRLHSALTEAQNDTSSHSPVQEMQHSFSECNLLFKQSNRPMVP